MCCRDRRLSFRFIFPPTTTIVSPVQQQRNSPFSYFLFFPFARNSCGGGGGGAVASKETNQKICLFFIFFRVVAPSSSLSRTLTADLAFPSLSLSACWEILIFSFILCRKPAQLLSRDFHRQCDVVVVCPFTDRATDIRRASIKQKNKTKKQKTHRFFDFCFCRFPHPDGHGDLNFSI